MIYGVGTDLIEIKRVEGVLRRFGERFAKRILCDEELEQFRAHGQPSHFLAKRFAAKEAFTKALGTGIHAPANWHGVWVINLKSGKPQLEFSKDLQELLRQRNIHRSHLSLTDEKDIASATVILECGG